MVDLRYVNRFVRYEPVRYEQLTDVLPFAQRDWYAIVTDLKFGYHHLRLRHRDWPYLAVHWKGRTLLLTHLPFRLASACAAFTTIQAAFYCPLRYNGSLMAYLINNRYAAAETPELCVLDGLILALTATTLGTFFSLKKADWQPKRSQRFLGLEVDSQAGAFRVPLDKQEYFMAIVQTLLDSDTITTRQLVHVAGLIVSMSMAVNLCPMFTRRLFLAIVEVESWDTLFPTPAAVREELTWWQINFHKAEGCRWPTLCTTVIAVGNASETHAGAFFPGGDLTRPLQVALPHHLLSASSTARELFAVQSVLQTFMRHAPSALRSKRLLYHTDSQASTFCVARQRGVNECLDVVRNIHLLAWEHDVELELVWSNRENPWQVQADYFSKATDPHNWGFVELAVRWIYRQLEVPYDSITLDTIATMSTTVCERFIA